MHDPEEVGTELRLALAMRGGVSLAVWIGGACREIDDLRNAKRSDFWGLLKDFAGYGSVAVDVMAGASAGGLNAVVYTASQVYGFELEQLRQVWCDLGDLKSMLRSGTGTTPSLLQGDEYFLEQAQGALAGLLSQRDVVSGVRVATTLSATLVEPIRAQAVGRVGAETEAPRYASWFQFRHFGSCRWLSDFAEAEAPDRVTWPLALAARATSSYPVAFEAALVHSARPKTFTSPAPARAPGRAVDMQGLFAEATSSGRPFAVMDGGVLDNIPLARAIESIKEAPADRRTRRVLVYVRPGGPGEVRSSTDASPRIGEVRSTKRVLGAVAGSRVGSERITADLQALEEHNGRIARARRLRMLRFKGIDNASLCAEANEARATYLVQRSDAEAQDTRFLLEDPIARLGGDPFPVPPAGVPEDAWRAPLLQWAEGERIGLSAALAEAYSGRLQEGAEILTAGIDPIRRLSVLLREIADVVLAHPAPEANPLEVRAIKERLYRLRFVATELMQRPRRMAWVVMAVTDKPTSTSSVDDWAAEALTIVDDFFYLPPTALPPVKQYLTCGDETLLDDVRQAQLVKLDLLMSGTRPEGDADVRQLLIDQLVCWARTLTVQPVTHETAQAQTVESQGGHALHRCLYNCDVGWPELSALEILTFSEAVVGEPGYRPIELFEVSSTARTPIAGVFPRLLDDANPGPRGLDAAIARMVAPDAPCSIPVTAKLAGNELNNFAAFLKEEWRMNDWLWGRIDAVPALVDVLLTPRSLTEAAERRSEATAGEKEARLCEHLQSMVVGPESSGEPASSTAAFMKRAVWEPRAGRIASAVRAAVSMASGESPAADIDPDDVRAVRDALIARRQWDVVAAHVSAESPREVIEKTDDYWVGLQTLSDIDEKRSAAIRGAVPAAWGLAEHSVPALRRLSVVQKIAANTWRIATLPTWRYVLATTLCALVGLGALLVGPPLLDRRTSGLGGWGSAGGALGAVLVVVGYLAARLNRAVVATFGLLAGAALVATSVAIGKNRTAALVVFGLAILVAAIGLLGLGLLRRKLR